MDILLSDIEIREALKIAYDDGQLYGDDGKPLPEKAIRDAQHQRDVMVLEEPCTLHAGWIGEAKRKCPFCWKEFMEAK